MLQQIFCAFCLGAIAAGAATFPDSAPASPNNDQDRILLRARSANTNLYSSLKSFVCKEEIQRYKGNLQKTKTRFIDHVSTKLSFENGVERYEEVRQNEQARGSMPEISGAWSEGEFGTLLQQTGRLLEVQPVFFVAYEDVGGVPTAVYRFEVPEKESPWDLTVGSRHYQLPFTTDVWISVASGEILKIQRKSLSIPAETRISEIDWAVSLKPVDLSGAIWLLPVAAGYSVTYGESKRREWNEMSFSNYRRYGSESVIVFDRAQ